jgi:hypothetical protein
MPTEEALKAADTLIHVLWLNAGLSCDGDSVSLTAATQPPGGKLSTTAVGPYGSTMRRLRKITTRTLDKEPKWRTRGPGLTTGATRTW